MELFVKKKGASEITDKRWYRRAEYDQSIGKIIRESITLYN